MVHKRINPLDFTVYPLSEREDLIDISKAAIDPAAPPPNAGSLLPEIQQVAEKIISAKKSGASVMLTYGAHLVKNGGGLLVNHLLESGWITHVATHGAGIIHDWEFASTGTSSESVAKNAPAGRFGHWQETGMAINLAVIAGAAFGLGFGESIGKLIDDGIEIPEPGELEQLIVSEPGDPLAGARCDFLSTIRTFDLSAGRFEISHPFKQYSIPGKCYQLGIPMTVHPGIGYDIFTNHPMFCGAAVGRGADTDIRIFTESLRNLTGGVHMSVGSSVMSPQIFEKAFSAANNLLQSDSKPAINDHYMAIVDIQDGGGWDWSAGEPPADNPAYYLRFCKSFYRMGGTTSYIQGDNITFIHNLINILKDTGCDDTNGG